MIILDTHAWIWYVTGSEKLSDTASGKLANTERIGVCAISCWEVAMLVSKKRLGIAMDVQPWITKALERPKINLVPLSPDIAVLSSRLPGEFHGDPADRMIVASCLDRQSSLVTRDKMITRYEFIETI